MWKPVSKVDYATLAPRGQILVVSCPLRERALDRVQRWRDRACAIAPDSSKILRDVVRDLLANPQVRAIVFDGPACGRAAYDAFWAGAAQPTWRIDEEHLALVRGHVDLYDDDFSMKVPAQPYWPARIAYTDDMEMP